MDEIRGEGWQLVRPTPAEFAQYVTVSDLVPEADWFWTSLQRFCVPDCCGLAAYDFSGTSVAWACGWGTSEPDSGNWRSDAPGDPIALAAELRSSAALIRRVEAPCVSAALFNDFGIPESYAALLEDLAQKVVPPSPTP